MLKKNILYLVRDSRMTPNKVYFQVVKKTMKNYKVGETFDIKLPLPDENYKINFEWVIGRVIGKINNIIKFEIVNLC